MPKKKKKTIKTICYREIVNRTRRRSISRERNRFDLDNNTRSSIKYIYITIYINSFVSSKRISTTRVIRFLLLSKSRMNNDGEKSKRLISIVIDSARSCTDTEIQRLRRDVEETEIIIIIIRYDIYINMYSGINLNAKPYVYAASINNTRTTHLRRPVPRPPRPGPRTRAVRRQIFPAPVLQRRAHVIIISLSASPTDRDTSRTQTVQLPLENTPWFGEFKGRGPARGI